MKRTILGALAAGLTLSFAVPAFAATVDQRDKRQEKRIKNGEKTGKLTPAEAAQLESQQKALRQQKRAERKANGGKLTPAERKEMKQEQNQASKQIAVDKHNGAAVTP